MDEKSGVEFSRVEEIFRRFSDGGREVLVPLVQAIQEEYGWLSKEVLEMVSERFKIPLSKIYGVVTFYAQFYLEPRGRHLIRCCRGTACFVRGATGIIEAVEETLKIKDGETTEDLSFSFETVACLGACALAPVVVIDEKYYGKMTPEKVKTLLNQYRNS